MSDELEKTKRDIRKEKERLSKNRKIGGGEEVGGWGGRGQFCLLQFPEPNFKSGEI